MKILQRLAGGLAVLSVILVLLITAIEIAAYSDFGYYEREYGRLGVLNDVPMELEDLMDVTQEMLSYLRGGREDLNVETVIDEDGYETEVVHEPAPIYRYEELGEIAYAVRVGNGYTSRNTNLIAADMLDYYYGLMDNSVILLGRADNSQMIKLVAAEG